MKHPAKGFQFVYIRKPKLITMRALFFIGGLSVPQGSSAYCEWGLILLNNGISLKKTVDTKAMGKNTI